MQALAPTGSIAVSENTRRLVEGYFLLKPLGPTRVKGLSEPINVYEVTGIGPLRTRLQRAAGRGLTKFVGRAREMEALKHAAELAKSGRGQIVAAMAEAGVGKSRLLFEFKAVAQSDCLVLEAYSVSHGKASAYVPVVELLRKYFRIVPEDDPRQRRQKVIGKLLELDRSLEDAVPYVFGLLGIQEGDDPFAQMDAQIRRRRTQDALKRILLRESLNQPLIVVFEDLHWIDSETQALLNLLADSIANARILLLVNYRPEYRHEWGHRTHYTQLRLDPLSAAGAEEMLEALLVSGSSLPGRLGPALADHGESGNMGIPELKRLILDRTQGNPFFIEEIVQARHKCMSPRLYRAFSLRASTGSRQRKRNYCKLSRQGVSRGPGQSSGPADRGRTRRIAQAIESLFAERLDDHVKQLALHYSRSGDALRAIEYLLRAGQQATSHAFFEEAIAQLHAALELLPKLDDAARRDAQELAIRMALLAHPGPDPRQSILHRGDCASSL